MEVGAALSIDCLDKKSRSKGAEQLFINDELFKLRCQAKFRKRKNTNSLKNLHFTLKYLTYSILLVNYN